MVFSHLNTSLHLLFHSIQIVQIFTVAYPVENQTLSSIRVRGTLGSVRETLRTVSSILINVRQALTDENGYPQGQNAPNSSQIK
jgi:hypothetical protein